MIPGAKLGPYEIGALLGAGGMGEVYRAKDIKLGRDVALKILPASFTNDPERVARFRREAQVLASLNHPHIGQIYGLEEANGTQFLVLELVDGESLDKRIARGPIPVDEALGIAKQIAEALEAAHEKGIIHRDLKPANIALTIEGQVKVLDFGLAKTVEATSSGSVDAMNSPTITSPAMMTSVGVILGTATYMSPEQAKGLPADKRSDVWAFGCVFYEMLTGKRAFDGEGVTETLALVLMKEARFEVLPAETPIMIREVIRGCLNKDRRRRIVDLSAALFVLDTSTSLALEQTTQRAITAKPPPLWRRLAIPSATCFLGAALAGTSVWLLFPTRVPVRRVTRSLIGLSGTTTLRLSGTDRDVALTPDGTHVVYIGAGSATIVVRPLDQLDGQAFSDLGTTLHGPFVSPDGQWIGFFDGGQTLKKVAITGGAPVTLAPLDGQPRGASWGSDGTIIFATSNLTTGLQRVSATGDSYSVLTRPNSAKGEGDHLWPEVLPGSNAVLFTLAPTTGGLDQSQIAVLDLSTGVQTILVPGGSDAHYLPTGHLIYAAGGMLRAIRFDLAQLTVIGTSVPVLSQMMTSTFGAAELAAATDGTLVYVPSGVPGREALRGLTWVDRQGHETAIAAPPRAYSYPRLSPDGTRIALYLNDQEQDIWLWDLERSILTRVTSDPGFDTYPVWMPDGRRLVFSSERGGGRNLFMQEVTLASTAERLTKSGNRQHATSVSPDGGHLVFTETSPTTGEDVMELGLNAVHQVAPLVRTQFTERNGEISPDGHWLAYEANDSGELQVYLRPYPEVASARWQVSTTGGTRPLWARNSQELFYLTPAGALMQVGVTHGTTWAPTSPTTLVVAGRYFAGTAALSGRTYDVSPDGRRFLMIKEAAVGTARADQMVLVQNWFEELNRLAPTK
jgi:serine/threonine-protein kinase